MSASLVGSEMCIRDSTCKHVRAHARKHAHVHKEADADEDVHAEVDADAVSYTHLTLPTICSV
eukprot:6655912-Alexandrium_andersonii.AAC.1